jgi:hypothetical protein
MTGWMPRCGIDVPNWCLDIRQPMRSKPKWTRRRTYQRIRNEEILSPELDLARYCYKPRMLLRGDEHE